MLRQLSTPQSEYRRRDTLSLLILEPLPGQLPPWQRRTNFWLISTNPARGAKRLRTMAARRLRDAIPRLSQRQAQARETWTCDWLSFATRDCSPCAKALASRPVFSAHARQSRVNAIDASNDK